MTLMIQVYTSPASATPAMAPAPDRQHMFAWTAAVSGAHPADPYVSEELAAEIREALAAVQRGEAEDLGSFAQYAEDDDED